jgi:hypothetical protein
MGVKNTRPCPRMVTQKVMKIIKHLLFSRVAFPIVFLTFHFFYWSILISVSNFQEDPQDPLIPLLP